jgi:C4-dicarboxylate transporter, DctM subunit
MEFLVYLSAALIIFMFISGSPLAIAFAFGSSVVALFVMGMPLKVLAQLFFSSINSYPLLACPFFIMAGNLTLRSGAMPPLKDAIQAMFGHLPGGLALATIVFATFLGAISGSSSACLAIIGTVLLPIFVQTGYDRPFGAGLAVTAAEIGPMIPPSLFFIIFGALNNISIAELFIAAIGPGVLTAIFMSITAIIISKRRNYATSPKASWKVRWKAFKGIIPLMGMPVVILGGIYGGFFSPTQAGSTACLYSVLMSVFFYHGITWKGFVESAISTTKISSMIYMLIMGSDIMGRMLAYIELPQLIAQVVISMDLGPLAFLMVVNILLLLMGFFFSSIPMIIIVLPLFLPTVGSLGIDPVFYGVLAVMCALIGEITPPFGPQLWIAAPVCQVDMAAIWREAWPFLVAWAAALILTTFIPSIAMFPVYLLR